MSDKSKQIEARIESEKKILSEVEEFDKEITEIEKNFSEVEEAKNLYLKLKEKSVLELEVLRKNLSPGTFEYLFGSDEEVTSKKNKTCSKESINFQTVKRFLDGENLFDIAKDIYKDKTHKNGTNRVIDGKPDIDTAYLTGRHISDFFLKCPDNGRITVALSRKNGKIYPPVIELTDKGRETFE